MEYKYIFSIVMAVYNCEPFLRETLDSIVNQKIKGFKKVNSHGHKSNKSLPFEEIVQVIMVDDGSTDSSGKICDEYADNYPNFIAVHKENGGVASARNEGLKYVQGKYMNFLDSDDKLSNNALMEVYNFFEKHYEETDVVTMPLVFFDSAKGDHWQNDKFDQGSRVINLLEEYNVSLKSASASFFKSEFKDLIIYDGALPCAEDVKYILDVLSRRMTLGVIDTTKYFYRRRSVGEESLVTSVKKKRAWYFEYFTHLVDWSVDFYKNKFGYVPYFLQYSLLSDIHFRFTQEYTSLALDVLGEEDFYKYKRVLYDCLGYIDDKIILDEVQLNIEQKYFILCKKYGCLPKLDVIEHDIRLSIGDTELGCFSDFTTQIDFMHIREGKLCIEGYSVLIDVMEKEPISIFVQVKAPETEVVMLPCTLTHRKIERSKLKEPYYKGVSFEVEVELNKLSKCADISIVVFYGDIKITKRNILFGKFCPVSNQYRNSYYYKNGLAITHNGCSLHLQRCKGRKAASLERALLKELRNSKMISDKKAYVARILIRILNRFKTKPIWLIADRISIADDNGTAMFKYVCENKKQVKAYFVLDSKSPDYEPISRIGRVVPYNSFKHKLLHLMADVFLSSRGEDNVFNPFGKYRHAYSDILSAKLFVFLQHGVTIHDISGWLNRFNKNIQGFVTSSKLEQDSILQYSYYYDKDRIWLTGMPRYDYLYDKKQKMITFMPTWRRYLNHSKETFLHSDYFKFYTELFSHEKLLSVAKEYGYRICVKPHPELMRYIEEFNVDSRVNILDTTVKYRDIYAESGLVVTDYSSAVLDFAYMGKPVVYTQFDSDTLYSGEHVYTKGYFDFERDGFGEVVYDLDCTVDTLIEYMKNDCRMKPEYSRRAEKFFAFRDKNNCERVYDKIIELVGGHKN